MPPDTLPAHFPDARFHYQFRVVKFWQAEVDQCVTLTAGDEAALRKDE